MPKYQNTASPSTAPAANPLAPFNSLRAAILSQSPPTLPYVGSADVDPLDVINMMSLPVNTLVVTARGRAQVDVTDKHS